MTDRNKITDKIRKLLALSQSSNAHEAELAAQKASDLMKEHQLGMSDVDVEETARTGTREESFKVPGLRMKYAWVIYLAQAAAKLFDGAVLKHGDLHGTRVTFIGAPDDIESMKQMFMHLFNSWQSFVEEDLKAQKAQFPKGVWQPKHTMKFKVGHGTGYAMRMIQRVDEIVKARKDEVQQTTTGTALVVLKDQQLSQHMARYKSSTWRSSSGMSAGREAGRAAANRAVLGGAIE